MSLKSITQNPLRGSLPLDSPLQSLFEVFALLHLLNKLYTSLNQIASFTKQETKRSCNSSHQAGQGGSFLPHALPHPQAASEHSACVFRTSQQLLAVAATVIALGAYLVTGSCSVCRGLGKEGPLGELLSW